jgi:tetratricopeptide (TPR) repeat protein
MFWSFWVSAEPAKPAQPVDIRAAVHSEGVDPLTASPVQSEQAQLRFKQAKELYEAGQLRQALNEFRESRAIVASPNSRLYIARCLRDLGQLVEAYSLFGRTVVEAVELARLEPRYSRTAEAARNERALLEKRVGFVKVTVLGARTDT